MLKIVKRKLWGAVRKLENRKRLRQEKRVSEELNKFVNNNLMPNLRNSGQFDGLSDLDKFRAFLKHTKASKDLGKWKSIPLPRKSPLN